MPNTEIAEQNDKVALITGDLGFGVLTNFAERFPNQFINAGVAEQNMTTLAVGMALSGGKFTPIQSPISPLCDVLSNCETTPVITTPISR